MALNVLATTVYTRKPGLHYNDFLQASDSLHGLSLLHFKSASCGFLTVRWLWRLVTARPLAAFVLANLPIGNLANLL